MYARSLSRSRLLIAVADATAVFSALLIATWLRHALGWLAVTPAGGVPWADYLFPASIAALLHVLSFRLHDLYEPGRARLGEAISVAQAGAVATILMLALTFFYRGYSYSRGTVLLFYPLSVGLVVAGRALHRYFETVLRARPEAARRVLIVGFGSVGRHLGEALLRWPSYYELLGFLDDDPSKAAGTLHGIPVLGRIADLQRIARDQGVDEVLIAIPSAPRARILEVLEECLRARVRWKVVPDLFDLMLDCLQVDQVAGLPLVGARGEGIVGSSWALKRGFDLVAALLALVMLSPLFALIALVLRFTSRGPIVYRQERIGRRGRPFTLLKFRSMREPSDPRLHQSFAADWIHGRSGNGRMEADAAARAAAAPAVAVTAAAQRATPPVHKLTDDPRITAVGRLLRRSSLDELPQFWNVVRGDMSIVGPRPAVPYEVERYSEWHKRRLEVLPGITGLWQVSGRNFLSFEEMVRLDIRYIETWSFQQDLRILLRTVPAVFREAY